MLLAFAVGESANGLGTFVFVCKEHVVETLMAEGLEEPFAKEACLSQSLLRTLRNYGTSHIRPRQFFQCVKAQTGIFCQDRTSNLPIT